MIDKWLAAVVIHFLLKALEKATGALDWVKVKADMDAAVRAFLPGTFFDDMAVAICDAILARAQTVLADGDDLKNIMELLAAGDWQEAFLALQALLMSGWSPSGKTANGYKSPEGKAYSLVKDAA